MVRNHLAKINELEFEIAELKCLQTKMEYALGIQKVDDNEWANVINSENNIVEKIIQERHTLAAEKDGLENHIIILESSFRKLLEQYENSKQIIIEVMEKEKMYNEQIDKYKQIIRDLKRKHNSSVRYTQSKLVEMTLEKYSREQEKIREIEQFKMKEIKNQINIDELRFEKRDVSEVCEKQSNHGGPLKEMSEN